MAVADTDYNATYALTDVCDNAAVTSNEKGSNTSGAIMQDGISQKSLYDFLSGYLSNFNSTLTKLDSDTGVTDTDYADGALSAIGSAGYKIEPNGWHQTDLVTCLTAIEDQFKVLSAKLDGDAGVTDTNYSANDFDLNDTSVYPLKITAQGIHDQGDVVDFLNSALTAFNTTLTKLDAD